MSRRVVVTGMGAISPIGNDVPTMWKTWLTALRYRNNHSFRYK